MAHVVWTVGHSNRDIDAFLALLAAQQIELIADVRRYPGSRVHPQFNQDALKRSAREVKIDYRHFPDLGGRRSKIAADSPNRGWRIEAFNAYADYLETSSFQAAFGELSETAESHRTAMMCSEAVPWRCHRRLIADVFIARGWKVFDIIGAGPVKEHLLTPFARISEGRITYPDEATLFPDEKAG